MRGWARELGHAGACPHRSRRRTQRRHAGNGCSPEVPPTGSARAARGHCGQARARGSGRLPASAGSSRSCWGGCGQWGWRAGVGTAPSAPGSCAQPPTPVAFLRVSPPRRLCVWAHVSGPRENALSQSECQNPHGLQWNQGGYSCHGNLEVFPVPPRELTGSWPGAGAARQVLGGDGLAPPSTELSPCPFLCAWHPCQHCLQLAPRRRPRGLQEVNFVCVFSPAACRQLALPTPTCPQSHCSVHQLLSKLTIHFMYFNLGRTFIWLKFPFRGLECAFHTQAEMMCSSFVRRSLVYKDSN